MLNGETRLPSQPINPKPNNEDHDLERGDPLCSDIPGKGARIQKISWMTEFLEHRKSHASSSHEPTLDLEPTPARSVVLGKHSVCTHFSKTKIARAARRLKLPGFRAEDALAEPYLVQKILVIWLQQIQKFTVKSWCRTWSPRRSSHIRAKQKLLRKQKGACKSSWSRTGSVKDTYTGNSLEFGKACKDLSWNHCTSTPHRSEIWCDCWKSSAQR